MPTMHGVPIYNLIWYFMMFDGPCMHVLTKRNKLIIPQVGLLVCQKLTQLVTASYQQALFTINTTKQYET